MNGLARAITGIILANLVLVISCTRERNNYGVSVTNGYFEDLYRPKIGEVCLADTLSIGASTPLASVAGGSHLFSVQTASGLLLSADLHLQGDNASVQLVVNEDGKLSKK